MKEKIIQTSPCVFTGLSTTKPYKGKAAYLYDGNSLFMEVELEHPLPSQETETGVIPGIEENFFVKRGLRIKYPEEAEGDIKVFAAIN